MDGARGQFLTGAVFSCNQDGDGSVGRLIDDYADLIDLPAMSTAPATPRRASNRMVSETPRATFAQSSPFSLSRMKIVARSESRCLVASSAMSFSSWSKFFSEFNRHEISTRAVYLSR